VKNSLPTLSEFISKEVDSEEESSLKTKYPADAAWHRGTRRRK
jgi:hypothetical protein